MIIAMRNKFGREGLELLGICRKCCTPDRDHNPAGLYVFAAAELQFKSVALSVKRNCTSNFFDIWHQAVLERQTRN